ncbi:hypothetical protein N8I77_010037 [Diaporthe amygdali]|uniref:Metallo-beta-lactamase domain-containing protein n=1 Tax=Phomopsis amygdali TaxID=1214568 RepID=A0AAD9S666_PHOAM|nr:hypothetical protein N8I77_010037 [Diaporthe amygdali]
MQCQKSFIIRTKPTMPSLRCPGISSSTTLSMNSLRARPAFVSSYTPSCLSSQLRPLHLSTVGTASRITSRQVRKESTNQSHPFQTRNLSSTNYLRPLGNPRTTSGRALFATAVTMADQPTIHDVFESKTGTWQYVVADPNTSRAAIIDPVLDFDPATQALTTGSADTLLSLVSDKGYKVDLILETHAHADHLTAGSYLQSRLSQMQGYKPPIGIGKRIGNIQDLFSKKYGIPSDEVEGVFERLFDDDETFEIGTLSAKAIHLPGHTPDHLGYMIGDNVFCGDSLFHADIGTARCDFPGGDASALYKSGRKLLSLPDHVKIWTGHDYPPQGREPMPFMTVEEHKRENKHLRDGISEQDFVTMRNERDEKLSAPRLMHPSLQMNIRSGRLPKPTSSGQQLLHLPLKLQDAQW